MARNRYEEGLGVTRMHWRLGTPPDGSSIVLVEVWRSSLRLFEALKPSVTVTALVEVRVRVGDEWRRLSWNGALVDVTPGTVRRWAPLPSIRSWSTTISIEGWER